MILIHQIFYDRSQVKSLEPEFVPFDNSNQKYPFNYEYAVFFELFKRVDWSQVDYCGALSWKFHLKTGLSGRALLDTISRNPGYDVYLVNPFPELIIYNNIWEQGEEFHPYIKEMTKLLLSEVGYDPSILDRETPPKYLCYCNYWVANKGFWEEYMAFLEPIWKYITLNQNALVDVMGKRADPLIGAPYLPFVFERLFSTFLTLKSYRVLSIPIAESILSRNKMAGFRDFFIQALSSSGIKELDSRPLMKLRISWRLRMLRHYYARVAYRKLKAWIRGASIESSLKAHDVRQVEKQLRNSERSRK